MIILLTNAFHGSVTHIWFDPTKPIDYTVQILYGLWSGPKDYKYTSAGGH